MPDPVGHAELQAELQETRAELQETRAQLEKLQAERDRDHRRNRLLGRWGLRLLAGQELRASSRAWFEKLADARSPRELASQESADLFTAIARRALRIGFFGLVVGAFAVLTPLVTLWQSFLIREQVAQQAVQNTLIQRQVDQQAADTLIVRRAQLLATIYDEECFKGPDASEGDNPPEETCRPRSHLRAREEAVKALGEIERAREVLLDLNGAKLSAANLSGTNLGGAGLNASDLSRANLSGTDLSRADLRDADLRAAVLGNSVLRAADLSNADLRDADLTDAVLSNADLSNADLSNADLSNADLRDADFRRAVLINASLIGTSLEGSKFSRANLGGADLMWIDLSGATLWYADLSGANLRGADLMRADLRGADLRGADLGGADLRGADFSEVDLMDAKIKGPFTHLYLIDNNPLDKNFRGAAWPVANLEGADLRSAKNLTQEQINDAVGDSKTKIPEGLSRPTHWAGFEIPIASHPAAPPEPSHPTEEP